VAVALIDVAGADMIEDERQNRLVLVLGGAMQQRIRFHSASCFRLKVLKVAQIDSGKQRRKHALVAIVAGGDVQRREPDCCCYQQVDVASDQELNDGGILVGGSNVRDLSSLLYFSFATSSSSARTRSLRFCAAK
jgi:hypothetical protein